MSRSVRLRPWQKRALDRRAASAARDFLAMATPGAGKTTFALCAAVHDLAANPGRRLVTVAPTAHLKLQWADAAAGLGLHLEPRWAPSGGRLPADVHGIVTTYQQVASSPDALRPQAAGSLAVLDEIHHAGDDRAWGGAVRRAFEPAARRLALSGTPFRSDTRALPSSASSVFDVDEAVLDHLDRHEDDAALELALPALPPARRPLPAPLMAAGTAPIPGASDPSCGSPTPGWCRTWCGLPGSVTRRSTVNSTVS
jgi:Type III restriction enzyme, res subunit